MSNMNRLLELWRKNNVPLDRVDWDTSHMSMAYQVSKRSPDANTKVGAILTNDQNQPVSAGYNGFISGIDDSILPNQRPDKIHLDYIEEYFNKYKKIATKYFWMIHAEVNAILNAAKQGKSTRDTILYITGRPCPLCLMLCYQSGIKEVVYDKNKYIVMCDTPEDDLFYEIFPSITNNKMKIRPLDFKK